MSRRMSAAAFVAALSIVVLAAGFASLRGGSTPVPVDTAVDRFRENAITSLSPEPESAVPAAVEDTVRTSSRPVDAEEVVEALSSASVRPLPPEGVYRYATSGGDEVDVLGGSRHTYPAETTITVSHTGCGLVERWDALEERWDERESCRSAEGDRLKRTTSFHRFFGRSDQRTLHCDGFTYPAGAEPGDRWNVRCATENTVASMVLEAVGWEDVEVAGVAVRTLHVRVQIEVEGEQQGTGVRDVWGSVDSGINVRERATLTSYSNQPVFGRTRYHESYELELVSLEPKK